jgi:hypothetical protein
MEIFLKETGFIGVLKLMNVIQEHGQHRLPNLNELLLFHIMY